MYTKLQELLQPAHKILLIIANNPDADSVGSALALAEIMRDLNKEASLYCQVEIPRYLRFLAGWQQIMKELPVDYDVAIMVDNSVQSLLQNKQSNAVLEFLQRKPLVILDHHASGSDIEKALIYNQPEMVATGELIYNVAQKLNWPLNQEAATLLAASILSDSLGFSSQSMVQNSRPLKVVAALVDLGVNLALLNDERLKWQQVPVKYIDLKADLLKRIRFQDKNQIAYLVVEHEEIKECGNFFNPTIVLDEMRFFENVKVSLGFKKYQDQFGNLNRLTLRIRCYDQTSIAQELAETFSGGGHPYAAGVKWEGSQLDITSIRESVLKKTAELLK